MAKAKVSDNIYYEMSENQSCGKYEANVNQMKRGEAYILTCPYNEAPESIIIIFPSGVFNSIHQ